jgi:hypothetical protein
MADILSNLASTLGSGLKSIGQQNNQFKNAAAQQNNSISRFVKDIGRYFSTQTQQQNGINSSIGDLSQATSMNSAKIDQTNSLVRESISVQNQMLVELRTTSNYFRKFTNDFNDNQNNGNSILSTIASILGGAAVGAAATAGISAMGGFSGIDSALTGASNYISNGASNLIGALGGGGNSSGGFSDTVKQNQANASGSILSTAQMTKMAKEAGFNDNNAAIMGAIGAAESSGNTRAYNGKGRDDSYGIWQINMEGALGPERRQKYGLSSNEDLYDPAINLKIAKDLFNESGFKPWGAFTDGRYQQFLGTAQKSIIEGDDMGIYPRGIPQPQNNVMGGSGGNVTENQQGIRKLPINSKLKGVLQQAARAAGVDVEVFSGGQPRKGEGGQRTGSTRHDHGNAADVYLYKEGRKLRDPEDREIMAKFVSAASSAGATGIGFGGIVNKQKLYMGESGIHVGFGTPATWGGSPWIASAASGVFNNKDLSNENGNYQSASATGPGGMFGGENNAPANSLAGTPFEGLDASLFGAAMSLMGGGAIGGGGMGILGGIGGMLQGLPSLFSSGSYGEEQENASLETLKPIESSQQPEAKTNIIQNAAVQSDSLMHNLTRSVNAPAPQQTASAEPSLPTRADQNRYSTSYGITASSPWYLQLAGRITNDQTMKMKGGVYV